MKCEQNCFCLVLLRFYFYNMRIRKSANSKINKFIIDSESLKMYTIHHLYFNCDFWRLQLSRNIYIIYLKYKSQPSPPVNYKKIWQKELSKKKEEKKKKSWKSQLPPCLEPSVSYGLHAWFCHLFVFSNSIHRVCILLFFVNTVAWTHSSVL